jgi:hypothetical protein
MGQIKCQSQEIRVATTTQVRVLIKLCLAHNLIDDNNSTLYNTSIVLIMTTLPQAALDALESLGDSEKSK